MYHERSSETQILNGKINEMLVSFPVQINHYWLNFTYTCITYFFAFYCCYKIQINILLKRKKKATFPLSLLSKHNANRKFSASGRKDIMFLLDQMTDFIFNITSMCFSGQSINRIYHYFSKRAFLSCSSVR